MATQRYVRVEEYLRLADDSELDDHLVALELLLVSSLQAGVVDRTSRSSGHRRENLAVQVPQVISFPSGGEDRGKGMTLRDTMRFRYTEG